MILLSIFVSSFFFFLEKNIVWLNFDEQIFWIFLVCMSTCEQNRISEFSSNILLLMGVVVCLFWCMFMYMCEQNQISEFHIPHLHPILTPKVSFQFENIIQINKQQLPLTIINLRFEIRLCSHTHTLTYIQISKQQPH